MITRTPSEWPGIKHVQRRLDRRSRSPHPYLVPPPTTPLLADALPHTSWSDAYAVDVPRSAPRRDPQDWADAVFQGPPLWIQVLFGVREVLVRAVGIEPAHEHVFDTVSRTADEVLLGADQAHLNFRVSVLVELDRVVVTTLVEFRNQRGVAYFALVRRVHPAVVRSMLARAARTMASQT